MQGIHVSDSHQSLVTAVFKDIALSFELPQGATLEDLAGYLADLGELHGGKMLRFNPQADHWTEYVLPEPYSHDRRTWIDDSTTPVTVWYVDHNSYLVRVQPRQ